MKAGNAEVKKIELEAALDAKTTHATDLVMPYVRDLSSVIDMSVIRAEKIKIGVDPLGGASVHYWEPIADLYGLDLTVVNKKIDPQFAFMPVDHDGKIRMDCSSPYAMADLVQLKDAYRVAFGNDPDSDRHGIVTPLGRVDEPRITTWPSPSSTCSPTARTGRPRRPSARRSSAAA